VLRVPLHQEDEKAAGELAEKTEASLRASVFGDPGAGTDPTWTAHAANSVFSLNGRERNMLFLNRGGGFAHLGAVSGADDVTDGRSFVAFDADDDGDLDLVVKNFQRRLLHYLRNDAETDNHPVAFRLEGRSGNRDAIGARLILEAGGRRRLKEVRSASGFLSQSPTEVFFGLGDSPRVDTLTILWPRGEPQVIHDLEADRRYRIVEGGSQEVLAEYPRENHRALSPDTYPARNDPPLGITEVRRIPGVPEKPLNQAARERPPVFERPTLVCFITSWCRTCREDLTLLDKLWMEPERRFDVVVVQVKEDPLPEGGGLDLEAHPFPALECGRELFLKWRQSLAFVVPSSFWVGTDRRIHRGYTGRLDEARLREDYRALAGRR
jgi:hypothetical protein